jgi:hypothetical protein
MFTAICLREFLAERRQQTIALLCECQEVTRIMETGFVFLHCSITALSTQPRLTAIRGTTQGSSHW